MWHGYFGIENLALNAAQRDTLIAALRRLGPASHPQPARLCHWTTRPDGQAAIFEALFSNQALTVTAWRNRLAQLFGVDPDTIGHATTLPIFDSVPTTVVTLSRSGTDYLRVALFAYPSQWAVSGAEARAYLAANAAEWTNEEED